MTFEDAFETIKFSIHALNSDVRINLDPFTYDFYGYKNNPISASASNRLFGDENESDSNYSFVLESVLTQTLTIRMFSFTAPMEHVNGSRSGVFLGWYSLPASASESDWNDPDKYTVLVRSTHLLQSQHVSSFPWDEMYVGRDPGRSVNVFIVAKYAPAYVITYDASGAYFGNTLNRTKDKALRKGFEVGSGPYESDMTNRPPGYSLAGWGLAPHRGGGGTVPRSFVPTADITLYAHWGKPLVFDANGGTVSVSSKVVGVNDQYGDLPVPSRDGYDFVGWFTNEQGGLEVSDSTLMSIYGQKVYAHWVETQEPEPGPEPGPDPEPVVVRRFIAMVKLLFKPLPHKVGTADIKSSELKKVTMQFMENFKFIERQMNNIMNAVIELQKKGG